MAKIRQSFRRKKKKGKEDTAKEESCPVPETAEQLDIEPFDKRSKFRRSLSFRKKKVRCFFFFYFVQEGHFKTQITRIPRFF